MDGETLVREYYRSIDEDDYAALSAALTGGFVHRRPDTTIEGREEFVAFMKGGRPERDTEHVLEAVYTALGGGEGGKTDGADGEAPEDRNRLAAEGRLLRADGSVWFRFVDSFETTDSGIQSVRTYVHSAS